MTITDGALQAAAELSSRYIQDRRLPDKAIDLIDEAGARLRIRRLTAPPELKELDAKAAKLAEEKDQAVEDQDFEKAAELRDKQEKIESERKEKESAWREGESDVKMVVDEDVIAEVISQTTGIPVFKLTQAESKKLMGMESELHKRIIGQDEAVSALSRSIRRARVGLKEPEASGWFVHRLARPTGVGKTELAKALAEFLFDDEDALIRVDMSRISPKGSAASRPLGAPPGYVGYEEGGELTEKVRAQAVLRGVVRRNRKSPSGHLQHAVPGAGRWPSDRRPGTQGGLQEHHHHPDHQPRHSWHRQGRQHRFQPGHEHRIELPAHEGTGLRRTRAAVPSGVPEPSG